MDQQLPPPSPWGIWWYLIQKPSPRLGWSNKASSIDRMTTARHWHKINLRIRAELAAPACPDLWKALFWREHIRYSSTHSHFSLLTVWHLPVLLGAIANFTHEFWLLLARRPSLFICSLCCHTIRVPPSPSLFLWPSHLWFTMSYLHAVQF